MPISVGYDCQACKGRSFTVLSNNEGKNTGELRLQCSSCGVITEIKSRIVKPQKEKIIPEVRINGRTKTIISKNVIVIIKTGDDGKTFKGIAKCHPDDEFNEAIGFNIALQRVLLAEIEYQLTTLSLKKAFLSKALNRIVNP